MEFRIPYILGFLMLALVASDAALAPELYWNSVLPNSPMPKAIKDLLHPDLLEDKSTSVVVGKGGVNVAAGKGKPGGTSVSVGKGGVNVGADKSQITFVVYYKDAATEDQLHDNRNVALLFLEKDMKSMNLDFSESSNTATFLPRQEADSIPFTSNKLLDAFHEFSVKPRSAEAEIMKHTIKLCENPGIEGEEKYCATSLESMVDFSTSKLGKNIQAISTEVEKPTHLQKYAISGVKKTAGDKSVVCHKLNYPYAVFYCHSTKSTRVYQVPLKGADGTKVKAVAICHVDTSAWNPKSLAFQELGVKPGTVPICHFLPQIHVAWVPK